jgi:serine phosphatase RsbU (regulator of sigma subunit)
MNTYYKRKKYFIFFTTIFLHIVLFGNAFSQTIILEDNKEVSSLGSSLSYYIEDESESYTIEEISNQNFDKKWLKNPSEHLNLGYNSNVIWLKIEVENKSQQEDWNLIFDFPYVDTIYFYNPFVKGNVENEINIISNKWKITKTGWYLPYFTRPNLESNNFIFPLFLSQNQKATYYLQIQSTSPVLFPLSISTQEQIAQQTHSSHIGYGIYFGILLVMLFYNLVIFTMTKDRNYLYYVFTVLSTLILFSGISSYLFKYLYPNFPEANKVIVQTGMVGIVISTIIFTVHFLEVRKYTKWGYRFFLLMFVLAPFDFLMPDNFWSEYVNTIIKINVFGLLIVGTYVWKQGNKFARFYVIAWTLYLIFGLMMTLRNSGTLPINFWTSHGAEIGSALEVVLISVALADRYRIIKKEQEIANKKALALEQQYSQELEEKVRERTTKLNESNEELFQINEELSVTLETMGLQKSEIESKNKDITASINYAKRIQDALLPSQEAIQSTFKDSFTLYLPKDVVSGDFYFFFQNENYTFLAVADCTGHGVPGSLMSMIGTNLLRESIVEKQVTSPAKILMNLHQGIVTTLKQKETGNRDGMDITICVINKTEHKMYFSGAKNMLIAIKDKELTEYKGSKFSIGDSVKTEGISFEDTVLEIDNQTSYYMYSDGYQDQFGGEKNKKFMSKNLKSLLQTIHKLPFQEQKQVLDKTLFEWKNEAQAAQIDDILVMGFKI